MIDMLLIFVVAIVILGVYFGATYVVAVLAANATGQSIEDVLDQSARYAFYPEYYWLPISFDIAAPLPTPEQQMLTKKTTI